MESLKLVIAIVKPVEFDETLDALTRLGLQGVTCSDVRDYGQKGPTVFFRGAQYTAKFQPMTKIEAVVAAEHVEKITSAIFAATHSARVLVLDMADRTQTHTGKIEPPTSLQAA